MYKIIPSKSGFKWLRFGPKYQNSQPWHILHIEQTIVLFYPIKIQLEMAGIWPKVAKQLSMAIMGEYLVASQMAIQIVLIEQTNFLFYPIKIQLEMAQIWAKVAKQLARTILGDQVVASQMASQIVLIKQTNCLLSHQNQT